MFELSESLELHQPNHVVIGKARKEHRKALAAQVNGVHFKRNMGWFLPGLLLSLGACLFWSLGKWEAVSFNLPFMMFMMSLPVIALVYWRSLFSGSFNLAMIIFYAALAFFTAMFLL